MFGLFNINKAAGSTSRDVVNQVQRLVRPAKTGHAGTLDPLATGVLIVGVGKATRLIEYVQRMPKQYLATFLLGCESDTEDTEGEVRELIDPPVPLPDAVCHTLQTFVGQIDQIPPAHSALKVKGKRAYKLARAGKQVTLEARPVVIHSIKLAAYEYPRLQLDICCGSGTYVRSLGRDIARSLGTAAVMSELERTAIGGFCVEHAIAIDQLDSDHLTEHLIPPTAAVAALDSIQLSEQEVALVSRGMRIPSRDDETTSEELAATDQTGQLVAILRRAGSQLQPIRTFIDQ